MRGFIRALFSASDKRRKSAVNCGKNKNLSLAKDKARMKPRTPKVGCLKEDDFSPAKDKARIKPRTPK